MPLTHARSMTHTEHRSRARPAGNYKGRACGQEAPGACEAGAAGQARRTAGQQAAAAKQPRHRAAATAAAAASPAAAAAAARL